MIDGGYTARWTQTKNPAGAGLSCALVAVASPRGFEPRKR